MWAWNFGDFQVHPMYIKWPKFDPPPLYKNGQKWHFRDHFIQNNGIFETPIQQNGIFESPLYKKLHFRDPLYNKMASSRPLFTKNGILETIYKKCMFETSLYKKLNFRDPPHREIMFIPLFPFLNGIALMLFWIFFILLLY